MTDRSSDIKAEYIDLTADIVAAYVSNNPVPANALAELIGNVHFAVRGLNASEISTSAADKIEKATPAEINKSITQDTLISFEDGKPYKTLKRHLMLRGLSPEAYRAKYGLPADYPMTSASYSAQRSELAKSLGLGQQRNNVAKTAARTETNPEAPSAHDLKRVGRSRKAPPGGVI